jgi:hypothetical protein
MFKYLVVETLFLNMKKSSNKLKNQYWNESIEPHLTDSQFYSFIILGHSLFRNRSDKKSV